MSPKLELFWPRRGHHINTYTRKMGVKWDRCKRSKTGGHCIVLQQLVAAARSVVGQHVGKVLLPFFLCVFSDIFVGCWERGTTGILDFCLARRQVSKVMFSELHQLHALLGSESAKDPLSPRVSMLVPHLGVIWEAYSVKGVLCFNVLSHWAPWLPVPHGLSCWGELE